MKNKNRKFRKEDFTVPENFMKCPICREDILSCDICDQIFDNLNFEVSCGKDKGHICGNCWRYSTEVE